MIKKHIKCTKSKDKKHFSLLFTLMYRRHSYYLSYKNSPSAAHFLATACFALVGLGEGEIWAGGPGDVLRNIS